MCVCVLCVCVLRVCVCYLYKGVRTGLGKLLVLVQYGRNENS